MDLVFVFIRLILFFVLIASTFVAKKHFAASREFVCVGERRRSPRFEAALSEEIVAGIAITESKSVVIAIVEVIVIYVASVEKDNVVGHELLSREKLIGELD